MTSVRQTPRGDFINIQGGTNTKYNKICIIALTGLMLAVFASGIASAQTFSGTDQSKIYGTDGAYLDWYGTAAQGPVAVSSGAQVTFANSLWNDAPSTSYPSVYVTYTDSNHGSEKVTDTNSLGYGSYYTPTVGETQTSSGSYTSIWHWYTSSDSVYNQNNQHAWTT
jgi:hypothetical protein